MNFLNEKYLKIGERIYMVTSGENGLMTVFSSPVNTKLEKLDAKGEIPKNRTSFSVCQLDDDNFLLVGGTSDLIYALEVYQFNISSNQWKEIKVRKKLLPVLINHESVTVSSNPKNNEYIIYIVGGHLEFTAFNDLLILTIKNSAYTYDIVKNIQKLQFARVGHSLTVHDSHAYLYGGLDEEGGILSSLIDIDFSLYIANPIAKILMKDSLCRRFMHVAYFVNEFFYIAGGYGFRNTKLDDAWKYGGSWSEDYIFKAGDRLCASSGSIYEINEDNVPVIIEPKQVSDHLDDVFSQLIEKYKLTPNVYLNILNKSNNQTNVIQNAVDVINDSISKLETIQRKQQPKLPIPLHVFLSHQMHSKIERKKFLYEHTIKQLKSEIDLYQQQLDILPPVDDIALTDINDFEHFSSEIEKMDEKKRNAHLLARSSRLVREQQRADATLANLREKKERNINRYNESTKLIGELEEQLKKLKNKTSKEEFQLLNVQEQRKSIKIATDSSFNYKWCADNPSEIELMKDREQEIIKENQEKMDELKRLVEIYDSISPLISKALQSNDSSILIEGQKLIHEIEKIDN